MLRSLAIRTALCGAVALTSVYAAAIGGALASEPAARGAEPVLESDQIVPPKPAELAAVDVEERLGQVVAKDMPFVTDAGKAVTFGQMFESGLPVIVSFNYSDCPMLCSLQLNALTAAMGTIGFRPGKHYQIVTVVLEPKETPASASETKAQYVERLPEDIRRDAAKAWTFLTGPETSVRAAADAVGLKYKYVEETGDYAHPAMLAFLSPGGTVTRYIYGLEYGSDLLRSSILSAGLGKAEESVGFILACFHFNPSAKDRSAVGVGAMRYGALAFCSVFLGILGFWNFSRHKKTRKESLSS